MSLMDRIDIIGALILDSKPYYGVEYMNMVIYPDLDDSRPSYDIAARYQSRLSNLTGLLDLSQETIKVYGLLRQLITEKERIAAIYKMKITEADFELLQQYSYHLVYRLIALVQYHIPEALNQNAQIYGLFGNAGIAHVLMFT
jgi:hypothetical protein